jgi:hypothetical protein
MNKKYDWDSIEKQYISGDMGLRELARMNEIPNHSLVMAQSSRRDWPRKRAEFRSSASELATNNLQADEARRMIKETKVRDNAIELIDEAITTMRQQMQMTRSVMRNGEYVDEPLVVIRATDIALLIDRLNVLFGRPSTISEERSLGISLSARGALGPDILRGIVEATRGIGSADAQRSPIPRIGGTGSN